MAVSYNTVKYKSWVGVQPLIGVFLATPIAQSTDSDGGQQLARYRCL